MRFLNYSIRKKFNATFFPFVILPIVLFGMGMAIWRYQEETRTLYSLCFQKLADSMDKIEDSTAKIQDIWMECMVQDTLLRIEENRATDRDYIEVRKWIQNLRERSPLFENICITLSNGTQFQAGRFIREDLREASRRVEEEAVSWKWKEQLDYVLHVSDPYQGDVIGYTARITEPAYTEHLIGILSIRIKETEIENIYKDFMPEEIQEGVLVSGRDGVVISSTDKSRINLPYEHYPMLQTSGQTNVLISGKTLFLCRYSQKMDWYLVYEVPVYLFYRDVIWVLVIVVVAVIICVIFGILFGIFQNKYVIRPIYSIAQALEGLERGGLRVIPFEARSDEIGMLQVSLNQMIRNLDRMIKRVYQTQLEKTEAELRALSEQINPHFLYNTLDSIHWKAISNKDHEVAEQILALSDIYRYLLSRGRDFIRIREEVYFLERYLFLMGMRFGERICWFVEVEPSVQEIAIPKLLLQPLLENAIHHGLEPLAEGGKVQLKIWYADDSLNMVVEDTGVGFGKDLFLRNEEILEVEHTFALKNIYERLKLYYPEGFEYIIQSSEDGGSRVTLVIRGEEVFLNEIDDRG